MRLAVIFLMLAACGAAPRDFTDGQVAGILASLDQAFIQTSETAAPRLADASIPNEMAAAHRDANTQLDGLLVSGLASQIGVHAAGFSEQLRAAMDPDAYYVTVQTQLHRQALLITDCILTPTIVEAPLASLTKGTFRELFAKYFSTNVPSTCFRICYTQENGGELPEDLRVVACEY